MGANSICNLQQATSTKTKMKSICLILLALAVYCNAATTRQKRQDEGCVCSDTTVPVNQGPNAPKLEFWCYVDVEACKQGGGLGETSRFWDKWVSYDLCDKNNADFNKNKQKFGDD